VTVAGSTFDQTPYHIHITLDFVMPVLDYSVE